MSLGSRVSARTRDYIQANDASTSKKDQQLVVMNAPNTGGATPTTPVTPISSTAIRDVVNVKIEAPIIFIPEGDSRLWVADLGTFDINKSGDQDADIKLSGSQTKLLFSTGGTNGRVLSNLNQVISNTQEVQSILSAMSTVVTDLEFGILVTKESIKPEEEDENRIITSIKLDCIPFSIQFVPGSLESLLSMIGSLLRDSSREEQQVSKMLARAEYVSPEGAIRYNLGYDIWEKILIVVDKDNLHVVNPRKMKIISSFKLDRFSGTTVTQVGDSKQPALTLLFRSKSLMLTSDDSSTLTALQFKLSSIQAIRSAEEEPLEGGAGYSSDYKLVMSLQTVSLIVASKSCQLRASIEKAIYTTVYVNGRERGQLQLESCHVSDTADESHILSIEPSDSSKVATLSHAILYSFDYREGFIDSQTTIAFVKMAYKVDHVRALTEIADLVVSKLEAARSSDPEKKKGDVSPSRLADVVDVEEQASVAAAYIRRSTSKLVVNNLKIDIYYKAQIKAIEMLCKELNISTKSFGQESHIDGSVGEIGLYDFHEYPFRKGSSPGGRFTMVSLSNQDTLSFKLSNIAGHSQMQTSISGLKVTWVQQRMLRLIDFCMYQVLEVFYPSLLSFSQHYSRADIVKHALVVLNDSRYIKQHIHITGLKFLLPSTVDESTWLKLQICEISVSNSRQILDRVVSAPDHMPWPGLESDIWKVDCRGTKMEVSKSGMLVPASDLFDLTVEVDMLKKLYELSYLFDVEGDVGKFGMLNTNKFTKMELMPKPASLKQEVSLTKIREQVKIFMSHEESREKIYVNGRYHIKVSTPILNLRVSNAFINSLNEVLASNINFDDGADKLLRNTYVASTEGLQIYTTLNFSTLAVTVGDSKNEIELLKLSFDGIHATADKKSNYVTNIELEANGFQGEFGDRTGVPAAYRRFFGQRTVEAQSGFNLLQASPEKSTLSSLSVPRRRLSSSEALSVEEEPSMSARLVFTPDGKKDIELNFNRSRIILFSFLSRFIGELLTQDKIKEHKGFETKYQTNMSFLIKAKECEICVPSQAEQCIVVTSNLSYHIMMAGVYSQHLISLAGAEVLDCRESECLEKGVAQAKRRVITRQFDLNFMMRMSNNKTDYTLSASRVLAKLTVYNLKTIGQVSAFQKNMTARTTCFKLRAPNVGNSVVQESETSLRIDTDRFTVIFIDNFADVFLPVMRADMKIRDLEFSNTKSTELGMSCELEAAYNNSRTAKWEPIIELLQLDFVFRIREASQNLMILVGQGLNDGLFVNFSEEFLEILMHCHSNINQVLHPELAIKEATISKMGEEFDLLGNNPTEREDPGAILYDSQFLVRNRTGYDFTVQTIGDRKGQIVKIKNMGEQFINFVITDEFAMREDTNRQLILIFDQQVGQKSPLIFSVDHIGQVVCEVGGHRLVVEIAKEELKRVAVISSSVRLSNSTNLSLSALMFSDAGVFDQCTLKKEAYPVPFNKIDSLIMIGLKSSMSEKINVRQAASSCPALLKIPLVCHKESYNHLCLDVSADEAIVTLDAKSGLRLFNYCPIPLEYTIKTRKREQTDVIFRGKPVEIYSFDPYQEQAMMLITANDTFRCEIDLYKIITKKGATKVKLPNKNGTDKIYLHLHSDVKNRCLYLYSKLNVFNESSFNLDLITFKHSADSAPGMRLVQGSDRNIGFIGASKHDSILIRPNNRTFDNWPGAGPASRENFSVMPKNINCTVNQTIRGGSDRSYYEIALVAIPEVVKLREGILTKTLTISAKYILVNNTQHPITVIQHQSNAMQVVPAQSRQPIIWRTTHKQLSFQIDVPQHSFMYSDFFECDQAGYHELYVTDVDLKSKMYFTVKVTVHESVFYFQVTSIPEEKVTLKVINDMPFDVMIRSKENKHEPVQTVHSSSKLHYAQCYPKNNGSLIMLQVVVDGGNGDVMIPLDLVAIPMLPQFYDVNDGFNMVRVNVAFEGAHKVARLSMIERCMMLEEEEPVVLRIQYIVNTLGLSVMRMRSPTSRVELINITITKLAGCVELGTSNMHLAGAIESIQVDNNADLDTALPVIFKKAQECSNARALEWAVTIVNPSESAHKYLHNLTLQLSTFELYLEEDFVDEIIRYLGSLSSSMAKSRTYLKYYADFTELPNMFRLDSRQWESVELEQGSNIVYVDNMKVSQIRAFVSYFQDAGATIDKDFELVSLVGVAVGGFEEALITLPSFERSSVFETQDVFTSNLASFYRSNAVKAAYSIIGSLNILGNPSKIARQFGGVEGLVDDTKLHQAIVSGVFGGVTNTTHSLAGVFSLMSGDKEFMKQRGDRRKKKASGVLQGMEQGAVSLFSGITEGLAGVVMQPIKGTKEEGAKGFFKGIAKGFGGLIVKPVSGVLDGVSKTAEGIQNAAKKERVLKLKRQRPPRAFYNKDMTMRAYRNDDAVFYSSLKEIASRDDVLIAGYSDLVAQETGHGAYLAITNKYLTIITDQGKTSQVDVRRIAKIHRPEVDQISIEYRNTMGVG